MSENENDVQREPCFPTENGACGFCGLIPEKISFTQWAPHAPGAHPGRFAS